MAKERGMQMIQYDAMKEYFGFTEETDYDNYKYLYGAGFSRNQKIEKKCRTHTEWTERVKERYEPFSLEEIKTLKEFVVYKANFHGRVKNSFIKVALPYITFCAGFLASYIQDYFNKINRNDISYIFIFAKFKDIMAPDDERRDAVDDWIATVLDDPESDVGSEDEGGAPDEET